MYIFSKSLSNSHMNINRSKDLNRPSWPVSIFHLLSGIISEFKLKQAELLENYPWLNSISTTKLYEDSIVGYNCIGYESLQFKTFSVGRYNTKTKIFSWSWVTPANQFIETQESNEFRKYGGSRAIELMTKANWYATDEELEEVLAVCVKLKSAIGIDVETDGEFQYFRLLLEKSYK